jgi:chromosome partitioning protein
MHPRARVEAAMDHELDLRDPDLAAARASAHQRAAVIALCNQKGGVGKTTTTINLGATLVDRGYRVLLVDFDPQGAASVGLGINAHSLERTVYNLLLEPEGSVADIVVETSIPGLDLVPANIDLSAAELQLVTEVGREAALQRVLAPMLPQYDVVLIDCQPSLGLLTLNALCAADWVLVPLECEFFALRGVALLMDTIDKVQRRLNPDLRVMGVLATMFDGRTVHAREVLQRLQDGFGDKVFTTVVNRTIKFPETSVAGMPITHYAPASPAAQAYRDLAEEVLGKLGRPVPRGLIPAAPAAGVAPAEGSVG